MLCRDLGTDLNGLIGNEEMTRRQAHMLRAYSRVGHLPCTGDTTSSPETQPCYLTHLNQEAGLLYTAEQGGGASVCC